MKTKKRSGNVFRDLGFGKKESANLNVRAMLMAEIEKYIKQEGITQAQAARRFGVTQPRVSDLIRGKITLFTADMLINMLASAGIAVTFHAEKEKAA